MADKVARKRRTTARKRPRSSDLDALYAELLHHYYDEGDGARAEQVACRLERKLTARSDFAASVRGEEVRSLLAELRGDLAEAIHCREAEIRKILELQSLTVHTRHWKQVAKHYDFGEVSDRLDLLAILYDLHGNPKRAIATLQESKQFCAAHQIPFDGQSLLDEIEKSR